MRLAPLALLNPEVDTGVLGVVGTIPEDLLLLGLSVAINGEPGLALVGEVALGGLTKADGAGVLGGGTGVRNSQANGRDRVLHNVKALEGSGDTVLGGERDGTVLAAADYSTNGLGVVIRSCVRESLRIAISWVVVLAPIQRFSIRLFSSYVFDKVKD